MTRTSPVELGIVEQRTKAVYEVLDGVAVLEVAKRYRPPDRAQAQDEGEDPQASGP
jgi:hypothetical protein